MAPKFPLFHFSPRLLVNVEFSSYFNVQNCICSWLKWWVEAVRDYEVLRGELPNNNKIAESLYYAQDELRKSRGEAAANMR
ncbi:hypothetical protein Nepgr_014513 [Nepenthes gracilis]|uniref:Uncharacterized protein n=1 Tax=Nepenthes gracilis TaxID=150966 RepID=A0AAD3XPK1_NEPGR|nr:hypothetical protein Nepgr_014513 [Nepenthes gracilis]